MKMEREIKKNIMILLFRLIKDSGWNNCGSDKNNFDIKLEEKEEDLYKLTISVINNEENYSVHTYINKRYNYAEGGYSEIKSEEVYEIIKEIFHELQMNRLKKIAKEASDFDYVSDLVNKKILHKVFNLCLDYNELKEEYYFDLEYTSDYINNKI